MAAKPTTGIMYEVASELIFVVAWAGIKMLGSRLPLLEVIFFRSASALLLLIPMVHLRHGMFRGQAMRMLLLRSLFGYGAMLLAFVAMIRMRMGDASTLLSTTPVFVAMFSPFLLGERFQRRQFALVIASIVGISMVMKPSAGVFDINAVFALMAGVFAALAMICLRKLRESDAALTITFYFTAFATVASAPFAFMKYVPPTAHEWAIIALVGSTATLSQIFLSRAYRYAQASTISAFSYSSVVGCYIAGLAVFDEIPDALSLAGAGVIISCGVGMALLANTQARKSLPCNG